MSRLTDSVLEELDEQGFAIVPDFVTGEKLKVMQTAMRKALPPWDELPRDESGTPQTKDFLSFPHEQMPFYEASMDPESIDFARRWLKTDNIHARVGGLLARYPGHKWGGTGDDASGLHVDNVNNSLLPQSEDRREFGQLSFWIHPEAVSEDQAPLRLIPKQYGTDMSKCVTLVCEAGTLCLKTNYTQHSASDYLRKDGQRYTCGYSFGRADHSWEGFVHYTHLGKADHAMVFRRFIGGLTASQREIWRFPPAGHPYYTEQTLALLEEQYPGWKSDEYLSSSRVADSYL